MYISSCIHTRLAIPITFGRHALIVSVTVEHRQISRLFATEERVWKTPPKAVVKIARLQMAIKSIVLKVEIISINPGGQSATEHYRAHAGTRPSPCAVAVTNFGFLLHTKTLLTLSVFYLVSEQTREIAKIVVVRDSRRRDLLQKC